jgi:hypothetical protein
VVASYDLALSLEKVQQNKSQINGNFAQLFIKDRFGFLPLSKVDLVKLDDNFHFFFFNTLCC